MVLGHNVIKVPLPFDNAIWMLYNGGVCGRFHNYFGFFLYFDKSNRRIGSVQSAFGILVHFKEFTTQTRTSFIMLHLTY
jgi:hypothetical protein